MSDQPTTSRRWAPGLIHALLDELATTYAGPAYHREITVARDEYFTRSGKVFEDDAEVHEARTLSFLEWYVIERPLERGQVPILDALGKSAITSGPWERAEALASLATSHRSLFDIAHVDGNVIELEDVLGGARFRVVEHRGTVGFEVGALLEARVVWDGSEPVFAKTFLFHPRDARTEILDFVDESLAQGKAPDDIMFHLAQLHLRWHRHGHNNAARIYKGGGTTGPVPL